MPASQLLWRIPLALIGGALAALIFPTEGIWALAPLVPALLFVSVIGARFWSSAVIGFHGGLAFYISHVEWLSLYLGPVPLIALAVLQALIFAPAMGLIALLWHRINGQSSKLGWFWFPLLAALIWTAREIVAINFPYGGFPWSRLAMSQAESVLSAWVYWGGMTLLSYVLALIGALLATFLLFVRSRGRAKARNQVLVVGGATAAVSILIPLLTPLGNTQPAGEITIAAVQGNARAGLFANPDRGSILANHVSATALIVESSKLNDLQLIVWPENASDLDPTRYPEAEKEIQAIVDEYGVPLTFGTITYRNDKSFNTTLLWTPDAGLVDYYDKKRPVPFAEFVPDREFWALLAPDLIGMVGRDYQFGTRDGIFTVAGEDLGSLICFEIAVDEIPRSLVADGAKLILSQTNNADFGYSDETFQQAAIAKLRAIETGRTVVNISTVGKSAIYAPNGAEIAALEWYEPGAMVETLPLRTGLTPAMAVGNLPDLMMFFATLALAVWLALSNQARPRQRKRVKR